MAPVTAAARALAYHDDGMYVFDKKFLMCKFCDKRVDHERKSTIDNHIKADSHINNRKKIEAETAAKKKRQTSISESMSHAKKVKEDREEFIKSTVRAFVNANIPLEKLDKPEMRKWFKKYVPGSGDLPSAQQLRDKYVPLLKEEYDDYLKDKVKGKKIVVLCDETTNRRGQAVFLTLFKVLPSKENPTSQLFVASVKILENANADECSKAILQTVQHYEVAHLNIVAIGSDSAAYMNLCIRLLRTLLDNPGLIHLQCWAHKLDKVVKIFPEKLYRLNECVSNTKKLFKNTRKRKHRYVSFLKEKYSFTRAKEVKQFPLPVMTRWGTWKKSVVYLSEYVDDVAEYVKKQLTGKKNETKAVKYFLKLKPEDLLIIKAEAKFVVDYCGPVCDLQLLVEGSKYPMSHLLYAKVKELSVTMSSVAKAGDSSKDIKSVLLEKTKACVDLVPSSKQKTLLERIKQVCVSCDNLLQSQMKDDTAREFFESSRLLFNPCKLAASLSHEKISDAKEKITILDSIPTNCFVILHSLLSDHVKENNANADPMKKVPHREDLIVNALNSMMKDHSDFAISCLQVLHVSVANVDSERGFSAYGDIFSPKRTNLAKEKAEAMMCIYFCNGVDLNNNDKCSEQVDDGDDHDQNAQNIADGAGVAGGGGAGTHSVYYNDAEDMAWNND